MVLTKVWESYKENWKLYISIVLLVAISLGVIKAAIFYLSFSFVSMSATKGNTNIILIVLYIIFWVGHLFWINPLLYAVNQKRAGVETTLKEAFANTLDDMRKIIMLAGIITTIFLIYVVSTYIGFEQVAIVLFLLLTLIFIIWYALFIPIWFLENKTLKESFTYSRKLLAGKKVAFLLEFAVIYILLFVLVNLLSFIIAWPLNKLMAISTIFMYVIIFFNTIIQIILASLVIVWIYFYYKTLKA